MSWDPARQHGRRHRQVAARVLARAGGRCQINGPGCIGVATEDDHIVPLFEGGSDEPANHQAACTVCHRNKTNAEAGRAKQKIIAKASRPASRHPGLRP